MAKLIGGSADGAAILSKQDTCRFRPKPAVHSLDQMTLHRADSGHSFQVQQSHGSEGRFSGTFQT
jgi:hypothetical protein